jgi:YD repeat-containing protein
MLKRLTALTLIYSLFIFSAARPTLAASNLSNKGEGRRSANKSKTNSCPTCAPKPQSNALLEAIDRIQGLGRMTQVHVLFPVQRSIREGVPVNFVSTATGHLAFTVNDLTLGGTMPILFQRFYSSERTEDRGLGKGWSFAFDDRITINGDAATLRTGDGSEILFGNEGHNDHFVRRTQEPSLHQSFQLNGDTVTEEVANLKRIYKKLGDEYRLAEIFDSNDNHIRISFDDRRNLRRVEGSAGTLELEWADTAPRLLAINDSAGRTVTFKREQQRLQGIVDPDGNEWLYDYSQDRLTRALDPLGRVMLRVTYDQIGRVIEAGDGAGVHTYDYDRASTSRSRRTSIADPLGIKTTYEHNNDGALVTVEEEDGRKLLGISYDASKRATRISSQDQGDLSFSFDAKNRVAHSSLSDGFSNAFTYDERGRVSSTTNNGIRTDFTRDRRGNIVNATSSNPSQSYRASYDSRGRLLAIESAIGRSVTSEYDAGGNVTAFSTDSTGRIQIERDAAGRTRSERFPSGLLVQYERNARGLVTRKSDNNGSLTFERDSSGVLTGIVRSDNTWIRAIRDQFGRIVTLNSSTGKSRRFAYDLRGGLADCTDSQGRHKRFVYDARGRLASVIDDEGNRTIIERDEKGSVKRVASLRVDNRRDYYSRAGRLIAFDRSPGQINQEARFVPIGSRGTSAWPRLRPAITQEDCIFGFDPSFDATEHGGMSCWDPFGDFGGGGSWGGCDEFDSFGCTSYFGDTYEQCVARLRQRCWDARDSCFNAVFRNYIIATSGCAVLTFTNPTGGAICAAAAYLTYLSNLTSCDSVYQNCLLGVSDRCRR